jgi:hypothetical protein
MPAVSETIVREYFELHGFFVRQQRKYIASARREDDEIDFFVLNPLSRPGTTFPFELASADLRGVARAVVVVKGWHTDTFSPGLLANAPEIFRFLEPAAFQQAARAFDSREALTKILVVPALPHGAEARRQSIELLRAKGIDAVIPFRTMLADLISHIEVNRNYQKSDLLQVIRILKNYDFFKEPQLELFKPKPRRKKPLSKGEQA